MDFDSNGVLYALDTLGNEFSVNPTNAALTPLGNAGSHVYLDLAIQTASVPEPSSIIIAGTSALSGLAHGWKRRRRSAG